MLEEKIQAMFIHLSSDDQPYCAFVLIISAMSAVLCVCHLLFLPNSWGIFYACVCSTLFALFFLNIISCVHFYVETVLSVTFLTLLD